MTLAGMQLRQVTLSFSVKWRKTKLTGMKPTKLIKFVEFTPRDLVVLFHKLPTLKKVPIVVQPLANIIKKNACHQKTDHEANDIKYLHVCQHCFSQGKSLKHSANECKTRPKNE